MLSSSEAIYVPTHVLSTKSARQHRNVFIWCTSSRRMAIGWRVDDHSPVTVSTAYRWITTAVLTQCRKWKAAESYALFPVVLQPTDVLMYSVHQNGPSLSRESQEIIAPGDYGLYNIGDGSKLRIYPLFPPSFSFSDMEEFFKADGAALAEQASLTLPLAQQALTRDGQCLFSGVLPRLDFGAEELEVTWIFPPFLGYELSDDPSLEHSYHDNPDACNLSEFMVVENVVSGRKDLVSLFWANKLGVDVDDDYRIIMFEGPECLNGGAPLKKNLTLVDKPNRPSDKFLRLHFQRCLVFSACRGDVTEDYREQEIENFMEELGVLDNEIDFRDARWSTPLGIEIHAHLVRQKMAGLADEEDPM